MRPDARESRKPGQSIPRFRRRRPCPRLRRPRRPHPEAVAGPPSRHATSVQATPVRAQAKLLHTYADEHVKRIILIPRGPHWSARSAEPA